MILNTGRGQHSKYLPFVFTEHDAQLSQIYDSIENLLDEKVAQRKWEDRVRIGFKK